MSWTPEKIKQLKKLWAKGKSTVEIGRELGISKNAVVGKVHRLELDARPSPIKKATSPAPKPQKTKLSNNKGYMTLLDLKLNSCRWPIGEPKDADFHFCGKDTVTGKPYCAEHCKVAYTSLKELANQNKNEAKKESREEIIEDAEFEEIDITASKPSKTKISETQKNDSKGTSSSNKKEKGDEKAKVSKDSAPKSATPVKETAKTAKNPTAKADKTKEDAEKTTTKKESSTKETAKTPAKKQTTLKTTTKETKASPSKGTDKKVKDVQKDEKSAPVASILKRVVNAAKSKRK